jgi:hypothetical protein
MQVYDLSAIDGALLCGGVLYYLPSVKFGEAGTGFLSVAALVAVHWLAPYPAYMAASIICPMSFAAYILRSRGGWQPLRFAAVRRPRKSGSSRKSGSYRKTTSP